MRHEKIIAIIALLLVLAPLGSAEELNPFRIGYAKLKVTASKSITADKEVMSASLISYDMPQEGLASKTLPVGASGGNDSQGNSLIKAAWSGTSILGYNLEFVVESNAKFNSIRAPSPFPLPRSSLPSGMDKYLRESHYVKITPEIAQKALEITAGSRDSFEAAARLTGWVHNYVRYDLKYGDVVLDSAWVFENKAGVCDEYSNLLIAMLRSAGIPARYASGIVYGGIDAKSWQSHAWVEAYISGEWAPFDPTYGEMGYVDATHVRFSSVLDAYDLESKIEWAPASTKITLGQTAYSVEVLETRPMPRLVDISIGGNVSAWPGASIGIYAGVRDMADGCIASEVTLGLYENKTNPNDGFQIIAGGKSRLAVVCPDNAAELGWVVLAPRSLAQGYTYYYDSIVYDYLSEKRMRITIDPAAKKAPDISAGLDKSVLALGETGHVKAEIKNTGGSEITELALFASGSFQKKSVRIRPGEAASFDLYFNARGASEDSALLYAPFSSVPLPYSVIASKSLRIKNISYPESIRPGESGTLHVILENTGAGQTARLSFGSTLVSDNFLVSLAANAEKDVPIDLSVPGSAQIGRYPMNVSVSSGDSFDMQAIDLLVYSEPKLIASVDFSNAFIGRQSGIPVSLSNKGAAGLKSILVSVLAAGDVKAVSGPASLDSLGPGETKVLSLEVMPEGAGKKNVNITVAYEDDFRGYSISKEIAFEAREMGLLDRIRLLIEDLLKSILG